MSKKKIKIKKRCVFQTFDILHEQVILLLCFNYLFWTLTKERQFISSQTKYDTSLRSRRLYTVTLYPKLKLLIIIKDEKARDICEFFVFALLTLFDFNFSTLMI